MSNKSRFYSKKEARVEAIQLWKKHNWKKGINKDDIESLAVIIYDMASGAQKKKIKQPIIIPLKHNERTPSFLHLNIWGKPLNIQKGVILEVDSMLALALAEIYETDVRNGAWVFKKLRKN